MTVGNDCCYDLCNAFFAICWIMTLVMFQKSYFREYVKTIFEHNDVMTLVIFVVTIICDGFGKDF